MTAMITMFGVSLSRWWFVLQLMQVVGERNVRIVPDISVSGATNGHGLVDGMIGMILRDQAAKQAAATAS